MVRVYSECPLRAMQVRGFDALPSISELDTRIVLYCSRLFLIIVLYW